MILAREVPIEREGTLGELVVSAPSKWYSVHWRAVRMIKSYPDNSVVSSPIVVSDNPSCTKVILLPNEVVAS